MGQVDGTGIAVLNVGTALVSEIGTMQDDRSLQGYPKVKTAPAHPTYETPRRSAAFVAQLLAIREDLPQTRERRREAPEVAAHVYEEHMAPMTPDRGKVLSRAA